MPLYIDPVTALGGHLLEVEKPARYTGGEAGRLAKKDAPFQALIAFPDLYEIGMSNQAVKIIYNRLNAITDISCDRAFAPAPDFEKLLREKKLPLYGLDTGIAIPDLDLLMFTIGYELSLNGVLTVLDVSKIPLRCSGRNETHPIIFAGGPAVSNPLPYSPFIDAFWMGEAEAGFFDLAAELAELKKAGEGRGALLEKISSHPNVWTKSPVVKNTKRAIYSGFSDDNTTAIFPIPSMKIVQHHGTVEIMRGCPNGCRFCHAGFWYRPMRQKNCGLVFSAVQEMVTKCGWRQISLSSLSSGDYCGIEQLIDNLNEAFSNMNVSFQLPSLKVSGFSLSLLEKISVTRKSGLTFAVETPQEMWQLAINKKTTRDSVAAIIEEAKKRGWKNAKFYFMIGLPVMGSGEWEVGSREQGLENCLSSFKQQHPLPTPHSQLSASEEEEIVEFVTEVGRRTRMKFNINVGIFIPKPHTPYQSVQQLDVSAAGKKLDFIRHRLKPLGHKVSVSNPLISTIEGLLCRGDERAGYLCEKAFLEGSRLDAWDDYINREKWQQLVNDNTKMVNEFLSGNKTMQFLQGINSCVNSEYLSGEMQASNNASKTAACTEKCSLCGVCNDLVKLTKNRVNETNRKPQSFTEGEDTAINNSVSSVVKNSNKCDPGIYRVLFGFSKKGTAVFHGHLDIVEIFSMALSRAGVPVRYTKGFNPLAKIEIASPLTLGISADMEIACADFDEEILPGFFAEQVNRQLPEGILIEKAELFYIPGGSKKHSICSLLWGYSYKGSGSTVDHVPAKEEKKYRQEYLKELFPGQELPVSAVYSLNRTEVLARNITGSGDSEWIPFFDAYQFLYK